MGKFWSIWTADPDGLIQKLSPENFRYWEKCGSGAYATDEKVDAGSIDENTVLRLVCIDQNIEATLEIGEGGEDTYPSTTLENGADVEGYYSGLDIRVPYLEFVQKLKSQPECTTLYIEYDGQNPEGKDIVFMYGKINHDEDEFVSSIE